MADGRTTGRAARFRLESPHQARADGLGVARLLVLDIQRAVPFKHDSGAEITAVVDVLFNIPIEPPGFEVIIVC